MKVQPFFLRSLGVYDEPVLPMPFVGIMSIKQTSLLLVSFLGSFLMFQLGAFYIIPFLVIPAIYIAFVKGKTFTPVGVIMNYLSYVSRTFLGEPKKKVNTTTQPAEKAGLMKDLISMPKMIMTKVKKK